MSKIRIILFVALFLLATTFVMAHNRSSNIATTKSSENDTLGGGTVRVTGILSVGGATTLGSTANITGAVTGSSYASFSGYGAFTGGVRTDSVVKFGTGAYYKSLYPSIWVKFVNKSGATIVRYSPVIADSTSQSIVATVKVDAGPDTLTEALEIGADGGYWRIIAQGLSLADACSLKITGTAAQNIGGTQAATVETLALTANATSYCSSRHAWTDLDTIVSYGTETNDSVVIKGYPLFGIKTAADNSTMLMGVVPDSIVDNDSGYVCVYGPAKVHTTGAIAPGMNLQAAGSNVADGVASVTVGASLGYALEGGTANDTLWCFIEHK